MKKNKLFTLLMALVCAMSSWGITVTITGSDFNDNGTVTKDGVTLTATTMHEVEQSFYGPGTFTTALGKFTRIEITANEAYISAYSGTDWTNSDHKKIIWAGAPERHFHPEPDHRAHTAA